MLPTARPRSPPSRHTSNPRSSSSYIVHQRKPTSRIQANSSGSGHQPRSPTWRNRSPGIAPLSTTSRIGVPWERSTPAKVAAVSAWASKWMTPTVPGRSGRRPRSCSGRRSSGRRRARPGSRRRRRSRPPAAGSQRGCAPCRPAPSRRRRSRRRSASRTGRRRAACAAATAARRPPRRPAGSPAARSGCPAGSTPSRPSARRRSPRRRRQLRRFEHERQLREGLDAREAGLAGPADLHR